MSGFVTGLGFLLLFFAIFWLWRNGLSLVDAVTIVVFLLILLFYISSDFLGSAFL